MKHDRDVLEFFDTDQLLAEVMSRFDLAVFTGHKQLTPQHGETCVRMKGPIPGCLGLSVLTTDFLKQSGPQRGKNETS